MLFFHGYLQTSCIMTHCAFYQNIFTRPVRTEANVVDSDGTLIFTFEQHRGTKLTLELVREYGKPCIKRRCLRRIISGIAAVMGKTAYSPDRKFVVCNIKDGMRIRRHIFTMENSRTRPIATTISVAWRT